MAGRPRKPLAINKKHFTKAEIEQRESETLDVPFVDVEPPDYLSAKQKREFIKYADLLLQLNILTELDADVLAQYCIAKELYISYSKQVKKLVAEENIVKKWAAIDKITADCKDAEEVKQLLEKLIRRQRGEDLTVYMNLQDKAHKQCLACARELGLTITSRAKLVIPEPQDGEDDEL